MATAFSMHVSLVMFARNKIAIQDAPAFCLQLLSNKCAAGLEVRGQFQNYAVVEEDLISVIVDRERAKLKLAQKKPYRRFSPKPAEQQQS